MTAVVPYSHGLCNCCGGKEGCSTCCTACCCSPCFTYCLIKKAAPFPLIIGTFLVTADVAILYLVGQLVFGGITAGAAWFFAHVVVLLSIRKKYGLMQDDDCMFILKSLCCLCCFNIQMYDSIPEESNESSKLIEEKV